MRTRGFTLLETMVAISILLTAMGGPFVVTQVALRTARKASHELVATGLAQEAIEYVRYWRDTNTFRGESSWLVGMTGSPDCVGGLDEGPQTCVVDTLKGRDESSVFYATGDPPFGCTEDNDIFTCPYILYDQNSGLFNYDDSLDPTSNAPTVYRRAVHMEVVREVEGNPVEIRVVSEVGWKDIGIPRSIKLEGYLTDWR